MVYEIRYLPHSYWYQLCRLIRTYVEFHSHDSLLNSLWPTDAILRRRTRLLLIVEVMACRLFGTGPLSESMLIYLNKHKLQGNLDRNVMIFTEQNVFENAVWKIEAILFRPQCLRHSQRWHCSDGFNIYWIKSLPMIVCHWYIILQTPYI